MKRTRKDEGLIPLAKNLIIEIINSYDHKPTIAEITKDYKKVHKQSKVTNELMRNYIVHYDLWLR